MTQDVLQPPASSGGGNVTIVAPLPVPVSAAALPLPAGAATEATLAALSGKLPAALVGGRLDVNIGAPATLPVSAAALPLPAGAATEATIAAILARFPAATALADNTANPTLSAIASYLMGLDPSGTWDRMPGNSLTGQKVNQERATLVQAASPAANTGATLTLPAAGAGLFHYVTHIYIDRHATAALAGGATLTITTTNLNGLTWRTGNQASITVSTADGMILVDAEFATPIRSAVANTASTIVLPAPGAAVLWTAWVAYYVGP